MAKWTLHAGRAIYKDGRPTIYVSDSASLPASDAQALSPTALDGLARRIVESLNATEPAPVYTVNSFDVCAPGMERLRNRSEFLLVASIVPGTSAASLRQQWLDDIQACVRGDWFDYDAARQAVESAMRYYVRPAFRRKRWNPFGVPSVRDGEESCMAYLFIESGEESV